MRRHIPILRWLHGPAVDALSPNMRGALWLAIGAMAMSVSNVTVKAISSDVHWTQIVFFRCLFGLAVIAPIAWMGGQSSIRVTRWRLHATRGIIGVLAMMLAFLSLAILPTATAVAAFFTKPLFVVVLAVMLLGERVPARRLVATVVGFAGALMIVQPIFRLDLGWQVLVALGSAALMGCAMIVIKHMSATERPFAILFHFSWFALVVSAGPAVVLWRDPSFHDLGLLVIVGALTTVSQYANIKGYAIAAATVVTPVEYLQIMFSGLLAFGLFGEVPALVTIIGACIVMAATFYLVRDGVASP